MRNAVQVLGGGKCLVTYTPEQPITHEIEVTFNGEQVSGSPFLCRVTDDGDDEEEILDGIAPPDFASTALDGDDGKGLEMGRGSIKSSR